MMSSLSLSDFAWGKVPKNREDNPWVSQHPALFVLLLEPFLESELS